MAEIGVVMLMFEAGLGTDMKKLKETGLQATAVACAGVLCLLYWEQYFYEFLRLGNAGFRTISQGLLSERLWPLRLSA